MLHLGLSFASPLFSPPERGKSVPVPSQVARVKGGEGCYNGGCFRQYPHAMDLLCEEIALTTNESLSLPKSTPGKTISKGHIDP